MRILFVALFFLSLVLTGTPARAAELGLEGNFLQGGLILGRAAPGSKVTLDGRRVRVTEANGLGGFITGLPPLGHLRVTFHVTN